MSDSTKQLIKKVARFACLTTIAIACPTAIIIGAIAMKEFCKPDNKPAGD